MCIHIFEVSAEYELVLYKKFLSTDNIREIFNTNHPIEHKFKLIRIYHT